MVKAVAMDTWTLARIVAAGEVPSKWTDWFWDEGLQRGSIRVDTSEVVYFFGPIVNAEPRLVVIDVRSQSGFFDAIGERRRAEAFQRLCRAAHASLSPGRESIPPSWGPYHSGSLESFFASHAIQKNPHRIEIDLRPKGTAHVYCYLLGTRKRPLESVQVDYGAFECALSGLDDAILEAMAKHQESAQSADQVKHSLAGLPGDEKVGLGLSAKQWLTRLSAEQTQFINSPLRRSVRLVGSAGTGKTLSLILKCLIEFERSGAQQGGYRSLFLTFSQSNVNHVLSAIASMDHDGILNRWPASSLKVCTIQALAYDSLRLDSYGLTPISLDGIEGRNWQRWILEDSIEEYRLGDWITRRARCTDWIRNGIEAQRRSPASVALVAAFLNEFACVIEPQGVRQGAEQREAYLKARRKPWMISLASRDDRMCVLDLYDRFRVKLRAESCIGADQLTADYLVELGTNRWDRIREREGFDVVFVDELHLFNRQERMIPHLLMRSAQSPPVVVMAYDFKQSTRVTFGTSWEATQPVQLSREMGLGETERFELNTAFRYTTEIATLLEWVDQAMPAVGLAEELGDEWRKVAVSAARGSGRTPYLVVQESTPSIYNFVFARAQKRARYLKKGSSVAVLCLSEQLFDSYLNAGAYRESFLAITDREQLSGAYRAGVKFILSMPEFVAGMQFDTVYLIEVNEGEVAAGPDFQGRSLHFVSQVYLGGSRAERFLEIYCSRERGGPARCLIHAVENSALEMISVDALPDPADTA
jgi:hypothetical protein